MPIFPPQQLMAICKSIRDNQNLLIRLPIYKKIDSYGDVRQLIVSDTSGDYWAMTLPESVILEMVDATSLDITEPIQESYIKINNNKGIIRQVGQLLQNNIIRIYNACQSQFHKDQIIKIFIIPEYTSYAVRRKSPKRISRIDTSMVIMLPNRQYVIWTIYITFEPINSRKVEINIPLSDDQEEVIEFSDFYENIAEAILNDKTKSRSVPY